MSAAIQDLVFSGLPRRYASRNDVGFMNITFEQFKQLAKKHTHIPLYQTLPADLDSPLSAFIKLGGADYAFLFESVVGGEKWARFSFIGTNPKKIYQVDDKKLIITADGKSETHDFKRTPLEVLQKEFLEIEAYQDPGLPRFFGGIVGYLGYDLVQYFSGISFTKKKADDFPESILMMTDSVVIFDSLKQVMMLVNTIEVPKGASDDGLQKIYDESLGKIDSLKSLLTQSMQTPQPHAPIGSLKVTPSDSEADFCQKVITAKEYIKAGDIFQVVLSMRFTLDTENIDALHVYRSLRRVNPSPYMYFLRLKDIAIVGSSPEVLVRLEDDKIELEISDSVTVKVVKSSISAVVSKTEPK